jgi:hypothetical protein
MIDLQTLYAAITPALTHTTFRAIVSHYFKQAEKTGQVPEIPESLRQCPIVQHNTIDEMEAAVDKDEAEESSAARTRDTHLARDTSKEV